MNTDSSLWYALAAFAWGMLAGMVLVFVRGATRRPSPHNLPPGYGEHYGYRSHFDKDDDGWLEPEMLRPMPDDLPEPINVIEAYQRLASCRVCGYRKRICSSEACPQRRVMG